MLFRGVLISPFLFVTGQLHHNCGKRLEAALQNVDAAEMPVSFRTLMNMQALWGMARQVASQSFE